MEGLRNGLQCVKIMHLNEVSPVSTETLVLHWLNVAVLQIMSRQYYANCKSWTRVQQQSVHQSINTEL